MADPVPASSGLALERDRRAEHGVEEAVDDLALDHTPLLEGVRGDDLRRKVALEAHAGERDESLSAIPGRADDRSVDEVRVAGRLEQIEMDDRIEIHVQREREHGLEAGVPTGRGHQHVVAAHRADDPVAHDVRHGEAFLLVALPAGVPDVRERDCRRVALSLLEAHVPVDRGISGVARVAPLLPAGPLPAAAVAGDRLAVVVGRRDELDDEARRQSVGPAGRV